MTDTIFALSTGAGRSAIAVIRLSGPASRPVLMRLGGRCPAPRQAALAALRHPDTRSIIDRGLVLWFPAPHSFTGEDAAEFQVHGSRAVIAALLDVLGGEPGCRPAEPGEFTRRAFANGKLDLAAAEGLADLIDAQTEAQRRQALHQLDGALGLWVAELRDRLVEALSLTEAAIDFVDEGDVATDALDRALAAATAVTDALRSELARRHAGERVRDGFTIALAGPPNAGKSTLLNALAGRDVALVSPIAGTTRDAIEVALDLGGFAVTLVDTAGLRESVDPLEQAGMDRARAHAARADLVLWMQDCGTAPTLPADLPLDAVLTVGSKNDAGPAAAGYDMTLSALTGAGVPALLGRLEAIVAAALAGGETALVTRARHRTALVAALGHLDRVPARADDAELVAEELRAANRALAAVVGRIETEEVLGAIFGRFCVGK